MDKLTLEHLAPYLPYGLKLWHEGHKATNILETDIPTGVYNEMSIFTMYSMTIGSKFLKPILRPLSDLTKEIEYKGERFVPYKKIGWGNGTQVLPAILAGKINVIEHYILLSWHFDVFGLIDAGLAIDINILNHD